MDSENPMSPAESSSNTTRQSQLNPNAEAFSAAAGVPPGTKIPANPLQEAYRVPIGSLARSTLDDGFSRSAPPPPHNDSLLDRILGPVSARGVDVQTMHYENDSIPIVGNPLFTGPSEEVENELSSIVQFAQPDDNLAGLPIGAGPEGDSHAGDLAACKLFSGRPYKRRVSSDF